MSNYYEELGLTPQATDTEIQSTIDTFYNQWRQAVTHPDPAVVDEANRNLRVLEQMRATLTDSTRRAGYDAGIGLGGAAGLADPTAVMQQQPLAPPRPRKDAGKSGDGATAGLWACPKCATDNPPQTKHCLKCGTQLVRMCPNCNQMASLVATGFCGNCGAQYDNATRMAELRVQQAAANQALQQTESDLAQTRSQINNLAEPKSPTAKVVAFGSLAVILLIMGISDSSAFLCAGAAALGAGGYIVFTLSRYNQAKASYENQRADYNDRLRNLQQHSATFNNQLAIYEGELARLERHLKS